jgi:glycosyltransferase involved in cell wall biosynthesis
MDQTDLAPEHPLPGGLGRRFAIITPYYKEKRDVLERCVESVRHQTVPTDHFMVSDGFPQDWLDHMNVRHISLGKAHNDVGNTPRALGALLAVSEGYDAIGFLDADNWIDSGHVEECNRTAESAPQTPVDLVIARQRILLPDGRLVNWAEDPNHVDTSCFWFLRGSFHLLHYWGIMPRQMAPFGDRVFYRMIKAKSLTIRRVKEITVNNTCHYEPCYLSLGIKPPPGAKPAVNVGEVIFWISRLDQQQQDLIRRRCGFDPLEFLNRRLP